jgi:enediyne biosynthesis protein E11
VTDSSDVYIDLVAEGDDLDDLIADLEPGAWRTPTPAVGWTVADQIAHLTFISDLAHLAAAAPARFAERVAGAKTGFQAAVESARAEYVAAEPAALLERWRTSRAAAAAALAVVDPASTVPWLVNPLPPSVLAAAGLMELFGHGQDVVDALGLERPRTDRIGHVAWFGTRVWDFGYQARGLTVPDVRFGFELTAPSGALWRFGPQDAEQRITGPALDFCLLVTRRRHREDLSVKAIGPDADRWLDIAQAYRGPAGPGRRPGQFTRS